MRKIKRWKVSLPSPDGYDIHPFDAAFNAPQEIVLAADYDAEVARLRGLLRDGLTSNIPEWRERVREVLGE